MRIILRVLPATLLLLFALGLASRASAGRPQQIATTPVHHYLVTSGWGNDDYAANIFTPHTLHVFVGDTVTWVVRGRLEPHTITFGPLARLRALAKNNPVIVPQTAGPPRFEINPGFAFPTRSHAVTGGFVNSGVVRAGQRWTARFPRAGTYRYYCLFHFPGMRGTVIVSPRPPTSTVLSGYGSERSDADAFFPENLTVHVGTTVTWTRGFHTVTFTTAANARFLRRHLLGPVKQANGSVVLALNPQVIFGTGGTAYAGGYWNSGLLVRGPARLTFTSPGVFHYYCLVHPGMDGKITVIR